MGPWNIGGEIKRSKGFRGRFLVVDKVETVEKVLTPDNGLTTSFLLVTTDVPEKDLRGGRGVPRFDFGRILRGRIG